MTSIPPPPRPRDLAQEIKQAINDVFKDQPKSVRFIGKKVLESIWQRVLSDVSGNDLDHNKDLYRIWHDVVNGRDDPTLLILASILIWIGWSLWTDFGKIFVTGRHEPKYRLPFDEDVANKTLPDKQVEFCEWQDHFLPKEIKEGDNHFEAGSRLPFVEEQIPTSPGVSGEVTKITVARGYFRDSKGNVNEHVGQVPLPPTPVAHIYSP